jgi:hypothetical protein
MDRVAVWWACELILVLAGAAVAAGPPNLDIPADARQKGMLAEHKDQVKARVGYWMKELAAAGSADDVVAVRKGLLKDYTGYTADAREFQNTMAEYTSTFGEKCLGQALRADDPLKGLKEVNLAIAASRMTQLPIQPLLEKMVADSNPGVRLLAWQGYARTRATILAASAAPPKPPPARVMFEAMRKGAATETDGMVAAEMIGAMVMAPKPEEGILAGAYSDAQKEFVKALEANWSRLCKAVLEGDSAMCEACQRGVRAVLPINDGLGGDEMRTTALQLALNAAWAAGAAYDRAEQILPASALAREAAAAAGKAAADGADEGLKADAKKKAAAVAELAAKLKVDPKALAGMGDGAELAFSRASLLLRDCEAALNRLTNKQEQWINGPLKQAAPERGAAVRLAVLKWEETLRPMGVKPPKEMVSK